MANRRMFLLQPGQQLISPVDPVTAELHRSEFVRATGLPDEEVLMSVLSPFPWVPNFAEEDGSGQVRPLRVKPEMAWHPAFWLPDHLRTPLWFPGRDGEDEGTIEMPREWIARVVLEVEAAGLYDRETGSWTDVFAEYADEDIDSPEGRALAERWSAGGETAFDQRVRHRIEERLEASRPEEPFWASDLAPEFAYQFELVNSVASTERFLEILESQGVMGAELPPIDVPVLAQLATNLSADYLVFSEDVLLPADGGELGAGAYFAQLRDAHEAGRISDAEALERVVGALRHAARVTDRFLEKLFAEIEGSDGTAHEG